MLKNYKRLWAFLKPYKNKLYLSIALLIITIVMIALAPLVEGFVTTQLLADVTAMNKGTQASLQFGVIYNLLVWLFVIYVVNTTTRLALQYLLSDAIQSATYDLRMAVKVKMTRIPIRYFDSHSTGDLMSRISTDVETISNALQQSFAPIIQAVLMLIISITMMFVLDTKMAIVGVSIVPLSLIASKFVVGKSQVLFNEVQESLAALNGVVQEKFSGFNEIKLYNYQKEAIEDLNKAAYDLTNVGFKSSFISGLLGPVVSLLTYGAIAIVIFMGANNVMAGVLTIGALQAFIRYIWQVNQPLSQMTQLTSVLQASYAAMGRVFEFLDEEEEASDRVGASVIGDYKGAVSFEHIDFGYDESMVLKDLSVDIEPGQMVAIVGPTGAGKTTIINLLMRFYDVNSGAIKIDGVDIRDMSRDDLRSNFGMVLQDTWLFSGRIRDNIAYGKKNATMAEIIEVSKEANVHHFIRTLPDGYNMYINEDASNISNGEKQLLTIARALLSDPKILILDEATSSVDTRLDAMIQEAMAKLMKGRTSFVIAHRLSTIKNADVILVVKDGNIIEKGNHRELIAFDGFYADLYNSQFADV